MCINNYENRHFLNRFCYTNEHLAPSKHVSKNQARFFAVFNGVL